jgi:hypothetical protein
LARGAPPTRARQHSSAAPARAPSNLTVKLWKKQKRFLATGLGGQLTGTVIRGFFSISAQAAAEETVSMLTAGSKLPDSKIKRPSALRQ